ncbi:MAG: type 4a pilus biogenesis protein PilO [Porticoccaceae bacterium]|nr:type 4a pilus biogenesis protein PilO [Pseudomonadales bacterium]MCP5170989.1 type 4a pilus biogenesis protein PilO [Pseudomonadales bacterium]MCP5301773.1 type 4a pilus biogenesis protein PilO [Pseudomonadales bacterium]
MSLANSFQELKELDFNELDVDSIGTWPAALRVLILVLVFALILVGVYFLHIKDLGIQLEIAKSEEVRLRKTFSEKAFQAANLEAYRQQMADVEKSFGALLAQLPSDTEVPGLLEDITEIGQGSSLTFDSITLQPERSSDFYVELPIRIIARGGYHDFASFVSGVAGLPRIVTMHDYSIAADEKGNILKLQIEARTYRYKAQEGE